MSATTDGTPAVQRGAVIRAGGDIDQLADAWTTLVDGANPAAQELVRLATSGRSEFVRFSASTAILDRVGFGKVEGLVVASDPQEHIDSNNRLSALQVLEARMAALASRRPPTVEGTVVAQPPEPEAIG